MNNYKLATPIQTISIRSIPNIPELNVIIWATPSPSHNHCHMCPRGWAPEHNPCNFLAHREQEGVGSRTRWHIVLLVVMWSPAQPPKEEQEATEPAKSRLKISAAENHLQSRESMKTMFFHVFKCFSCFSLFSCFFRFFMIMYDFSLIFMMFHVFSWFFFIFLHFSWFFWI